MGFVEILLIGLFLSVDSFSVSLSVGSCHKDISVKQWLKLAGIFTFFQSFFPFVGWAVGAGLKHYIETYDHWLAFVLLGLVGGKMMLDGFKKQDDSCEINYTKTLILVTLGIATSIDALVVGISFGMLNTGILFPIFVFGICTFLFSSLGVYVGKMLGHKLRFRFEILGGIALILIGIKILYEHLSV